jgi:protein-tyrosine phosphatase
MSDQDDAMDHSLDETSEMPSLILPFLYLGGKVVARARETLDTLNIRSIINCTPSRDTDPRAGVPNFYQAEKERFTYRRVPVFDSKGANLSQYFNSCVDFIDKSKHHGAVLVHCVQGVSRSTSIVLAYLMKSKGVPLDKALEFVRKRRPVARPNASFMKQLQDFEHRCMAERRQKVSGVRLVSGPARPTAAVPAPAAGPERTAAAVAAAAAAAAAAETDGTTVGVEKAAAAAVTVVVGPVSREPAAATAAVSSAEPPSGEGSGTGSISRKRSAAAADSAAEAATPDVAAGEESSISGSREVAESVQASSAVEGGAGDGAPSTKLARRPTGAEED